MQKAMDMETASPQPLAPPPYSPQPMAPPAPKTSFSLLFIIINLVLRILSFIFLLIGLVVLAINTTPADDGGTAHFGAVVSYRYTFSVIVIGFLYTLVQIGFALYRLIMGAKRGKLMLIFDFYVDKLLSYLLVTGAAAGFGAGIDLKRYIGVDDFFNKGNAATSLVFMASIFTIASSILSSYALPKCTTCN